MKLKRNKHLYLLSLSLALLFIQSFATADECPIPPGSIVPSIEATLDFDLAQQIYTYRYLISNDSTALLPIEMVRFLLSEKPESQESPARWYAGFYNYKSPGHMTWTTLDDDRLTDRSIGIWPSSYLIFPGQTKSGFVVKSKLPPGTVRFVAEGLMTTVPKADPDPRGLDDEPTPHCPGIDFYNTVPYGNDVSGTTLGPVKPESVISLRLKVKHPKQAAENQSPSDSGTEPIFMEVAIDPKKDKGFVRAELSGDKRLSSENFDVKKVAVPSLTLGEGKAPARNAKVAGNKLVAEFDIAKIGIRCDLDQALFLSGKTTDGIEIRASVRLKKYLCKHTKETKRIDLTPKPHNRNKVMGL